MLIGAIFEVTRADWTPPRSFNGYGFRRIPARASPKLYQQLLLAPFHCHHWFFHRLADRKGDILQGPVSIAAIDEGAISMPGDPVFLPTSYPKVNTVLDLLLSEACLILSAIQ